MLNRIGYLVCILVASFAFAPHSQAVDSSNGCGVGWYILKEQSLLSSTLRQTTNGFLPNTFSMTSGTSHCAKHSIVEKAKRSLHFLEANRYQLLAEMARGQGEYVDAFAGTFGCQGSVKNRFRAELKGSFSKIVKSLDHGDMAGLGTIYDEVLTKPEIATHCLPENVG